MKDAGEVDEPCGDIPLKLWSPEDVEPQNAIPSSLSAQAARTLSASLPPIESIFCFVP